MHKKVDNSYCNCKTAAFPPLTTGSSGHGRRECNLIADVTWPVSIGLQLQEPTGTNTARPSLENDTYAGHVSPPFPPTLILLLQTTVGGERWHDIAWITADTRAHDIAAVQFASQ